jgi:two-component system, cell cycle sensor histidine kinase and response regulator CckA
MVMMLDVFPAVLVVDDDRAQVAIVTSVLEKAGFRVLSAGSTLEALDVAGAATQEICLLVTDLNMPGASGRVLAAEMNTRHPGLKVLYLTAHTNELFQGTSALEPQEAFLEKPVSAQALREAINLLLRQVSPTS